MSALRIIIFGLFCLSLSFCSSAPKEEGEQKTEPQFGDYESSGVFDDIEKSDEAAATPSESAPEYKDDSYGDLDSGDSSDFGGDSASSSGDDSLSMGDSDESSEPVVDEPGSSSLPIADVPDSESQQSGSSFKDGMYKVRATCTMRAKASTNSKKSGTVRKGKKLWMEGHNDEWVKVYKKSGPVFISKICL